MSKKRVGEYLNINPSSITEIDSAFYKNYLKVYSEEPSRRLPSQLYQEFKIRSKKKHMTLDGYSYGRIHRNQNDVAQSKKEALNYAKAKFIKAAGLTGSGDIIRVESTGTYSFVHIVPKSLVSKRQTVETGENYGDTNQTDAF